MERSLKVIKSWLRESIGNAEQEIEENSGGDLSSYGAGYDDGYRDGLKAALEIIEGDPA